MSLCTRFQGLLVAAMLSGAALANNTPLSEEQCVALGGRFDTIVSSQQSFCNLPTQDAGQACHTSADCESFCLADTMTCAPYQTLSSGCHAYIHEDGSRIDICFD